MFLACSRRPTGRHSGPLERASQRDAAAIEAWRGVRWPELKKARANGWRVVFIDESGFYLLPALARTYAPAVQTPILHTSCRYEHLSVMTAGAMEGHFFPRARLLSA